MIHYLLVISGLVMLFMNHPLGINVLSAGMIFSLFEPDPFLWWLNSRREMAKVKLEQNCGCTKAHRQGQQESRNRAVNHPD